MGIVLRINNPENYRGIIQALESGIEDQLYYDFYGKHYPDVENDIRDIKEQLGNLLISTRVNKE